MAKATGPFSELSLSGVMGPARTLPGKPSRGGVGHICAVAAQAVEVGPVNAQGVEVGAVAIQASEFFVVNSQADCGE